MSSERASFTPAVLLGVTYAFSMMDRKIVAVLLEPIKQDMQLSDTQLGMMSGLIFALFYGFMGIPIARWADQAHRVNILSICLALWSMMTILSGMAVNFAMLLASRMGVGVGEAGCQPCGQSLIADYYGESQRGRALAIFALGVPLGSTVAAMLGGVLADTIGWRMTLIAVGAPGILYALFVRLRLKEPVRKAESISTEPRGSVWREMGYLLQLPAYRYALLGHLGVVSLAYALMIWGPSLMLRNFDISLTQVGIYTGIILAIGGALGSLVAGYLSDRLVGDNPAWLGYIPMWACLATIPALLMYIFGGQLSVFLLGYGLLATLGSAHTPPTYATYHRAVPARSRAMAVALSTMLVNLIGLGVSPVLIGFVSDVLAPTVGDASLRYALLVALCYLPLAAWCYLKVAKLLANSTEAELQAA